MWWVWIGRDGLIGRFQGVERIAISWLEIWPALGLLAQCQYSHNICDVMVAMPSFSTNLASG